MQWAVGSYALLFATALFAAGALGDRYGHRTVLVAGLVTFGAASAWAAWAADPTGLILARGVMGVGGAMIMPTSMGIIGSSFPPHRRPGAIAAWSASSGVGVALGPLIGGLLIDHFWWVSVFLVNPPIVVLAVAGILRYAPNPRGPRRRGVDLPGLLLSTVGLAALAYGLIEAGQDTDWGRPQVWAPVIVGVVVLAAFIVVESRSAEPSFNPRLFRVGRFAAGNLALAALFFAITGQMFYGNFFLQGARGMPAVQAGFAFLPGALGVVVGSAAGPRLVRRYGVARVSGTALFLVALGFAANLSIERGTSLLWFCTLGGFNGIMIGATIAPTVAAVLAVLPADQMGAGSAVNNTVRQVGSVLGIAVLGTVLTLSYRSRVDPALGGLPGPARTAAETSAEQARGLARALGRPDLTVAAARDQEERQRRRVEEERRRPAGSRLPRPAGHRHVHAGRGSGRDAPARVAAGRLLRRLKRTPSPARPVLVPGGRAAGSRAPSAGLGFHRQQPGAAAGPEGGEVTARAAADQHGMRKEQRAAGAVPEAP